MDDASFAYNGSNKECGRVFKWYRKALFQDRLRELGWAKTGCKTGAQVYASLDEHICMRALRLTTEHLEKYPRMHGSMDEYAGPQCYPQLIDDSKYNANNEVLRVASEQVGCLEMDAVREQMRCWLRCGSCGKWRLVEQNARCLR